VVEGKYPRHEARLEVMGAERHGEYLVLASSQVVTVQAHIRGEVAAAELVVRTLPEEEVVAELPMRLASREELSQRFVTSLLRPEPGRYQFQLRIRSPDGFTAFSPTAHDVLVVDVARPALVFVDHQTREKKRELATGFGEMLAGMGREASILDLAPADGTFYEALLEHYLDPGDVVVWVGGRMEAEVRNGFHRFLQRGGRLLIVSLSFHRDLEDAAAREQFYIKTTDAIQRANMRSPHTLEDEPIWIRTRHLAIERLAPAVPALVTEEGQTAGLHLDTDTFRLAYLAVELNPVKDAWWEGLVAPSLRFLLRQEVQEVVLEVPGQEETDQVLLLPVGQHLPVHATVRGTVAGAELLVRQWPGLEEVASIPMTHRASPGQAHHFEAAYQLPGSGHYWLFVRLHTAEGLRLIAPDHLEVLTLPAPAHPVLVFLDQSLYSSVRQNLRQDLEDVLSELGLETHFLDLASRAGRFYEPLLERYADPGKLVIWLGRKMDREVQAAFQRFLEGGGRLFLASAELPASPHIGAFLRDMLHVQAVSGTWTVPLYGPYTAAGDSIRPEVHYQSLELVEPAAPALLDGESRTAGLRVDTGTYRLVYLPFELHRVDAFWYKPIVRSLLVFLRQETVEEARLEVVNHRMYDQAVLIEADRPARVQAAVKGSVAAAWLEVRRLATLDWVAEVAMRHSFSRDRVHNFEAMYQPPEPGQYGFFLRLQGADGSTVPNAASMEVMSFTVDQSVLVFLDESYSPAAKDSLRMVLTHVLQDMDLEANVLDLDLKSEGLYRAFLNRYAGHGKLVIWLGQGMQEPVEAAFRAFLRDGGNLLIVSPNLHNTLAQSTRDMFHIDRGLWSRSAVLRSTDALNPLEFEVRYGFVKELLAPAEPMLVDPKGDIAGLRVDAGMYRLVYMLFDARRVEAAVLQELVKTSVHFLHPQTVPEARLGIKAAQSPKAWFLQPLIPQMVVVNSGSQISAGFRAGYEVRQGERVLAERELRSGPLAAQAETTLNLPAWVPEKEGTYGHCSLTI